MPDEDLIQVRRDDVRHIMSAATVSALTGAAEAAWERLVIAIASQPAQLTRNINPMPSTSENRL